MPSFTLSERFDRYSSMLIFSGIAASSIFHEREDRRLGLVLVVGLLGVLVTLSIRRIAACLQDHLVFHVRQDEVAREHINVAGIADGVVAEFVERLVLRQQPARPLVHDDLVALLGIGRVSLILVEG